MFRSKFSQMLVFAMVLVSFPAFAMAQVRSPLSSRFSRPVLDPLKSLKRLELPQLDRQPLVRHRIDKATFSHPHEIQMRLGLRQMHQQRFDPRKFQPIEPRKVTPEENPLYQTDFFRRSKPTDTVPRN